MNNKDLPAFPVECIYTEDGQIKGIQTGNVTGFVRPDTLRAICLITTRPNGTARARMGFVVIVQGKRPVYLDCRKMALKLPQVGWGYEIVNPNINKK